MSDVSEHKGMGGGGGVLREVVGRRVSCWETVGDESDATVVPIIVDEMIQSIQVGR